MTPLDRFFDDLETQLFVEQPSRQTRTTRRPIFATALALVTVVVLAITVTDLRDGRHDEREASAPSSQGVSTHPPSETGPRPSTLDPDAPVHPPAGDGNLGAPHQTSVQALRAHLGRSDADYLRGTDWGSARSMAIPGTRLRGWTFSQPGRRCLALPDPIAEGYGITCKTRREIAAGQASVIFFSPEDGALNVVGVLVASEQRASIETPPGTSAQWARSGNVYVGTAPSGSRLITAGRRQAIGR